jgi:hypothetical protein
MEVVAQVFFWLVAGVWLLLTLRMTREVLQLRPLPPRQDTPGSPPPKVSTIVTARDEAGRIETTVRRLLAQEGVGLEVVAVNDCSADATGAILDRVAAEDPRLRPVHLDHLPDGWLGKCHACHRGSLAASGDWLLFTDGDVWLAPDAVARAVQVARAEGVQHVCLMFRLDRGTLAGRAGQLAFLLAGLNADAAGVNRDRPGAHVGIGAFNLVDAVAYRAAGGHEPLQLTVLDDVRLGLLLRRAGHRTRMLLGGRAVEADWVASGRGLVQLLEKNLFSGLNYRASMAVLNVTLFLTVWAGAVVGPWVGGLAGVAAGLGLLSTAVPAVLLAARGGGSVLPALLVPLAWPLLLAALANSAWVTLRQGGIRWRGTFYPLPLLRQGNYR